MPWIVASTTGVAGAGLIAGTAWWHARLGTSLRAHRLLCWISGALCAVALGLLALGSETAGGAGFGLACVAFFCSVALFGPDAASRDDDDDDEEGGGGGDGPPAPSPPGPIDWARFEADVERWRAERQSPVP